jgi:hypothetical protein
VLEILKEVAALDGGWLFPGARDAKLSSAAMAMLPRRMKVNATVHGTARSGFRDWAAECTDHPYEVCEIALAHVVGGKSAVAYLRGDQVEKRRRLTHNRAALCAGSGTDADKVVPIPRANVSGE